jgi:uncharacterized DUF497 family protein
LVWRRAIAARKFLKNQGFPVFQKLWRFSVQCQFERDLVSDPNHISERDTRFDYSEERWQTIGMIEERCILLYVAHTTRENGIEVIRIINARRATNKERRRYGNRKI